MRETIWHAISILKLPVRSFLWVVDKKVAPADDARTARVSLRRAWYASYCIPCTQTQCTSCLSSTRLSKCKRTLPSVALPIHFVYEIKIVQQLLSFEWKEVYVFIFCTCCNRMILPYVSSRRLHADVVTYQQFIQI